jgi:TolB-like protein/Tfp pilus assembly protein PilF
MTPEGIKRETAVDRAESVRHSTGRKLDFAIIGLLVLAVAYFAFQGGDPIPATGLNGQAKTIAVLPFANMSGDPEQEFFSDGISEELLNVLAKVKGLQVTSRTSAFAFKGKDISIPKIAAELGVEHVLEGSVRMAGDRVRITAQLIDVKTDSHLWSESYDRDLSDIFAIQTDIAEQIARALETTLTPVERENIERKPTEDLETYNLYLLGRFQWNKFSEDGVKKARAYYEQAIARDSSFARAYAGLADVYLVLGGLGLYDTPPKEVIPKAKSAAQRAIALDPNLGEAHGSLGLFYLWFEGDWAAAEHQLKRGIEVDPNSALAHTDYSHYLTAVGRHEQAIREVRRALELDPVSPLIYENAAGASHNARRFDEALDYCQRSLQLNPDFDPTHRMAGKIYLQKGMYDEAISAFVAGHRMSDPLLGHAYGRAGRSAEAMQILRELEERRKRDLASAADLAVIHLGLGDHAEALRYLEAALDESSSTGTALPAYLKVDPIWDPIRPDPRFTALLERMGLEK